VTRGTHYVLPRSESTPIFRPALSSDEQAANLIRDKVARIYADEPDAAEEEIEADRETHRSKHQQFMHELSTSGKDLATVQTEWHNYYVNLSDQEKHQVWQEFYDSNTVQFPESKPEVPKKPDEALALAEHKNAAITTGNFKRPTPKIRDARSTKDVQTAIRDKVTAGGQLKAKQHLQSLAFGLGMGALVVIIFLFSFFNEVIIAPFIQPSRVEAATPVIVDSSTVSATSTPEVIIPKINVEIPVDYSEKSTNESTIESDLEDGIVHYPTTVMPGQNGNAAFFGHSSNNILNSGKYKFAFVLLHTLVPGDTFYLTYQGKVYIYKVISKNVVSPSDVSVLNSVPGQQATATLITCDPPGTSLNRLVVVGQQISPNPSGNTTATTTATASSSPAVLPGNGPTLLSRVLDTTIGKAIFGGAGFIIVGLAIRWLHRPKQSGR
jgi:LPXTG-site transpeptidase (sortase) family protein